MCKDMGGSIACTDRGVIVNGKTKKEWWIASDGYKFVAGTDQLFNLSPELLEDQRDIKVCLLHHGTKSALWP
jgi:hypothetical protein